MLDRARTPHAPAKVHRSRLCLSSCTSLALPVPMPLSSFPFFLLSLFSPSADCRFSGRLLFFILSGPRRRISLSALSRNLPWKCGEQGLEGPISSRSARIRGVATDFHRRLCLNLMANGFSSRSSSSKSHRAAPVFCVALVSRRLSPRPSPSLTSLAFTPLSKCFLARNPS